MSKLQAIPLAFLLVSLSLWAQTPTGTLQGTVKDPVGGSVPDAKVTVTNTETGIARTVNTDATGRYLLPYLLPGNYRIIVEKTGFQVLRQENVLLNVAQNRTVDLTLAIGAVTQEIRVDGTPPAVDVNTSTVGQVVDFKRIVELPLLGRNVIALAALTPGVNPTGGGATPGMGGGRNAMSEIQIDGATNIAPENNVGINSRIYDPQVDSVQEFTVQVNALQAEYGRFSGGVINIVTKSGTNELHGAVYEFLRNPVLNANGFVNNRENRKRTGAKINQFGYAVGGPVYIPRLIDGRNKSFFFTDYQGTINRNTSNATATVPLPEWLAGDFSNLRTSNGATLITIYDPTTVRQDPNNPSQWIRDPFPNNRIPVHRIDPVARNMASYWPKPNATPLNPYTQQNNFLSSGPARNDDWRLSTRWDHNWSDKWRMWLRVSLAGAEGIPFNGFGTLGTSIGDGPWTERKTQVSLDHTYIVSSRLIANLRYAFSRTAYRRVPFSDGIDLEKLGFSSEHVRIASKRGLEFPGAEVSSNLTLTRLGQPGYTRMSNFPMNHSLTGSMSKATSRHNFKWGGEYRVLMLNYSQYGRPSGNFTFNRNWTQREINTPSNTQGVGLASFLLGLAASGTMTHEPSAASTSLYMAGYFQDDWKVSSKLTLNLGLRYDVDLPRTERYNQMSFFDINAPSPLQGVIPASACPQCGDLRGQMRFVTPENRRQTPTDSNNWGPRFGFAYSFLPNMVLRGAYGIAFAPSAMQAAGTTGNSGMDGFNSTSDAFFTFDSMRTIYTYLRNPFPSGYNLPTGRDLGERTNLGVGIGDSYFDAYKNPYVQQWNLSLQRAFPGNMVLEVSYLGNRTIGLVDGEAGRQYNQLPASFLALGVALQDQVDNPFYGKIPYNIGPLAQPKVSRAQLLRPYPHYTSLQSFRKPNAYSIYHGMTVRLDKRFNNGLTLLFAYTNAKMIDDASSAVNFLGPIAGSHVDIYNWRNERSLSSFDISQRAVVSYVYELPFGRNRALLNHLPGWADLAVKGWQISGISTFQRGLPLIIGGITNNTNLFTSSQRANNNGRSAFIDHSGHSRDERMAKWFDFSVFSQPPAFTIGNLGRTLPDVRAPGINMTDLAVMKNTYFGPEQRYNFQLRAEAFSAFNHFNLGTPDTNLTSGNVGRITSGSGTRNIQLAAKFIW
jgi:hypothetical protein